MKENFAVSPALPLSPRSRFTGLLLLLLLPASCDRLSGPVATGPKVGNFALLDQTGEFHELHYYSDFKAVVLFSHGLGCQIVRNQVPALAQLQSDFEARGVKFLGINANLQDDRDSIARDSAELNIGFPILVDESQHVARSLGIERTAEAILIETASWSIAYRGPIDDRLDYGVQRTSTGQPFLRSAIESLLERRRISEPSVESPGCLIQFRELDEADLSFSDSVVPILKRHCLSCHREGGVAPFAMDSYRTVYGWAPMMREVVRTRRMPPWSLDPHVGDFSSPNLLTPGEERVLLGWIDAGSPKQTAQDPLAAEKETAASSWTLGEPDLVVEFEEQAIPATGLVPYRYVNAEINNQEGLWVRAAELRGTVPQVMHHALVFTNKGRSAARDARRWFRFVFADFAPGTGPDIWPEEIGRFLPPGSAVTLQIHYTPRGYSAVDRPRLGLYLHESRPRNELKVTALINYKILIPPYVRGFPVRAGRELQHDIVLYSIRPHMHYRGRSMRVWATLPGGENKLLLSVPNYIFDWQSRYTFSEPLFLPAGTRIEAEGVFDNSPQNRYNPDPSQTLQWGFGQILDEMLLVYLHHVELRGKERKGERKADSTPRLKTRSSKRNQRIMVSSTDASRPALR